MFNKIIKTQTNAAILHFLSLVDTGFKRMPKLNGDERRGRDLERDGGKWRERNGIQVTWRQEPGLWETESIKGQQKEQILKCHS